MLGDEVFYNTLISGLTFNYYFQEAAEITLETIDMRLVLNDEVYTNLLRNLYKRGFNKQQQANMLVDIPPETCAKLYEELTTKLKKIGVNIDSEKLNEKNLNYNRRRKSEDPYAQHRSDQRPDSPQNQQQDYSKMTRRRNNSGFDGNKSSQDIIKRSIFGSKK